MLETANGGSCRAIVDDVSTPVKAFDRGHSWGGGGGGGGKRLKVEVIVFCIGHLIDRHIFKLYFVWHTSFQFGLVLLTGLVLCVSCQLCHERLFL